MKKKLNHTKCRQLAAGNEAALADNLAVTVRDNHGVDSRQKANSAEKAIHYAETAAVTENHMICVELAGERI